MAHHSFPFRFSTPYRIAAAPFGVRPSTCSVLVTEERLMARFGLWRVDSPLTNIADVAITGPYGFLKTAGPAHLSLADRGLTFATNGENGVCVHFAKPVGGIEPTGTVKHPSLTVTVADCEGLVEALRS